MNNFGKELIEREKELDCLYEISAAIAERNTNREKLFTVFSKSLAKAMTYPDAASVCITASDMLPGGQSAQEVSGFYAESFLENGDKITISVSYNPPSEFVEREKKLVISAASLLANTLSKKNYYEQLEAKTDELKSKNTALKEVLFQIDQDRADYIKSTKTSAENILLPLICELEDSPLSPRQEGLVEQLKIQLETLTGSIEDNFKIISNILTPREIEICSMIKTGSSTKEIALYLNISPQTVERHRNTIRKKLGINRQNINLVMHLRNM